MKKENLIFGNFFNKSHYEDFSCGELQIFIYENGSMPSVNRIKKTYNISEILNVYRKKIPSSLKKYFQVVSAYKERNILYAAMIPLKKDFYITVQPSERRNNRSTYDNDYDDGIVILHYSAGKEKMVSDFIEEIDQYKIAESTEVMCNIIAYSSMDGYYLKDFKIKCPAFDMELNYGKELMDKDKIAKTKLSESLGKGLLLLHGISGGGKTTYIKSLISFLNEVEKDVIYVPPSLIKNLSEPEFVSFMMSHQNSVLAIEDGESIVVSRETNMNAGGVEVLLNMADGLLGEAMGVQLICTFNTKIDKIDSALKRKGRIIIEHEFKPLSIEQSQRLSDSLGFKTKIEKELTLAEIYNQNEIDFTDKERNTMGFKQPVIN